MKKKNNTLKYRSADMPQGGASELQQGGSPVPASVPLSSKFFITDKKL